MKNLSPILDSISMLDDNTVEIKYRNNVKVGKNEMKELLDQLYEFTSNKRLKRLVIISKNSSLDLAARLFLQEENKTKKNNIIAEAVVVTSLTQKMTTNFYLKFIKDTFPSQFFTDVNKAKEWLDSHVIT